jgi:carnitine O-acetyltransferase
VYKFLFNAARLPTKPVDEYVTYDSTYYHHVLVACKHHFFTIDTVDADGVELSTVAIAEQLALVRTMADARGAAGPSIGVLSSDHRDAWADARDALIAKSPVNAGTSVAQQFAAYAFFRVLYPSAPAAHPHATLF